jgi:hypothetical protein
VFLNNKGQSLIIILILAPALLLLAGIVAHISLLVVFGFKTIQRCDAVSLDYLKYKGDAISELAKINPRARATIMERRAVDKALHVTLPFTPPFFALVSRRAYLTAMQVVHAAQQKKIKLALRTKENALVKKPLVNKIKKFINQVYWLERYGGLQTRDELGYSGEIGAPQSLSNFDQFNVRLSFNINSLKLLPQWKTDSAELERKDWEVQCAARLKIRDIGYPWTVQITSTEGKPSSSLF